MSSGRGRTRRQPPARRVEQAGRCGAVVVDVVAAAASWSFRGALRVPAMRCSRCLPARPGRPAATIRPARLAYERRIHRYRRRCRLGSPAAAGRRSPGSARAARESGRPTRRLRPGSGAGAAGSRAGGQPSAPRRRGRCGSAVFLSTEVTVTAKSHTAAVWCMSPKSIEPRDDVRLRRGCWSARHRRARTPLGQRCARPRGPVRSGSRAPSRAGSVEVPPYHLGGPPDVPVENTSGARDGRNRTARR